MLKFLTHKLRTHSLNEDTGEKVEERDSGTESDDDPEPDSDLDTDHNGDYCTDVIMKWNDDVTDIRCGCMSAACECGAGDAVSTAVSVPAALPPSPRQNTDTLYDHHSSEEELEVINKGVEVTAGTAGPAGAGTGTGTVESRRRGASSPPRAAPEKRRWGAHWGAPPYAEDVALRPPSSDDDDTKVETPVRFCTSPPLEALKPRRAGAPPCACPPGTEGARSPAAAVEDAGGAGGCCRWAMSPRRRRAALPPPRRHRPALDFDKMQQLKVGGGGYVRAWRAAAPGPHGELSVFCW